MDAPPLTLSVLNLRPATLLLSGDEDPAPAQPLPSTPQPALSSLPTFSPTHSYPGPYPTATLGSIFKCHVHLSNTSQGPVRGVRMMIELQSTTRYRLGEVVHGKEKEGADPLDTNAGGVFETLPSLQVGEAVKLEVESEIKEIGLVVCIVSVAWETLDGRRTFQRFFKYNVTPPLAIKTRIQTPGHPNSQLDPVLRDQVYLEILAQNASLEGMIFDRVFLETVTGLRADVATKKSSHLHLVGRASSPNENGTEAGTEVDPVHAEGSVRPAEMKMDGTTLLPGETRQFLFILSPTVSHPPKSSALVVTSSSALTATAAETGLSEEGQMQNQVGLSEEAIPFDETNPTATAPAATEVTRETTAGDITLPTQPKFGPAPKSTFPAAHPPDTVLPLGRLDLTWRAGPTHDPGRLQTSTLNRRIPVAPPLSLSPLRALSASSATGARISPGSAKIPLSSTTGWEFDSIVIGRPDVVSVESTFALNLRLGFRTRSPIDEEDVEPTMPSLPVIGVQHLTRSTSTSSSSPSGTAHPKLTFSPPSRTQTPTSRGGPSTPAVSASSRPYSPMAQSLSRGTSNAGGSISGGGQGTSSRPMTPISIQLKQASTSDLNSPLPPPPPPSSTPIFPPPPFLPSSSPGQTDSDGQVIHLGVSLEQVHLEKTKVQIVEERAETTYTDPIAPMRRWEGTVEYSLQYVALREGLAELGGLRVLVFDDEALTSGSIGREWDSLGDVWVES